MTDQRKRDFLITNPEPANPLRDAINRSYAADETDVVGSLLTRVQFEPAVEERIDRRAQSLVASVRARRDDRGLLDAFMQEYDLSSEEGVILMCLAEAL